MQSTLALHDIIYSVISRHYIDMNNPNNLLINETSPYLLQHADNPVNWHPWNKDSLAKAKLENKPILLSIGYSACHWCHVMAHESFEDSATADEMNKHFINIKVDREERPDLDKIYQTAHSLLTSRSGGWPLTVFLSPDNQIPFFAGTYFPVKRRYNMPSFIEIMHLVSDAFTNKSEEIHQQNTSIQTALTDSSTHTPSSNSLSSLPLDLARKQLEGAFEPKFGGFSSAPKFPHAGMIERCLRHYLLLKEQNKIDNRALEMATFTLDNMALGGFQDAIGGGFFRYSTDDQWMIPHFEKMLYDNAQLFALFAQAFTLTNKPLYKQAIELSADWLIREMQSNEGGYCSALDADTDKAEGRTYVWTPEEVAEILSSNEYRAFSAKYNLFQAANFEGQWHLHSSIHDDDLAASLGLPLDQLQTLLIESRKKLLMQRGTRTQPGRDDKILCAWNALMIRGMSTIGRRLNNHQHIDSANRAADFIYNTLWNDQRLLASYKDGKAYLNAYLDDYAYLLQALIELLQSRWNNEQYQWCLDIANSLLENFEDTKQGGFFFTSHDHEDLLYRSKTFADDAMPNGNAVAASALLQLGLLSGQTKYIDAAERTIRCCYDSLSEHAISHCNLLHALELYLNPGIIIILRGDNENLSNWQSIANEHFIPRLICFSIEADIITKDHEDKTPVGDICAYICEGTQCKSVITDLNEFKNYFICMSHDQQ